MLSLLPFVQARVPQVGKKMFAISDMAGCLPDPLSHPHPHPCCSYNKMLSIRSMAGEMVIDQDTLNTVGKMKWNDTISTEKIAMITCAHPSQLPEVCGPPADASWHQIKVLHAL